MDGMVAHLTDTQREFFKWLENNDVKKIKYKNNNLKMISTYFSFRARTVTAVPCGPNLL